MQKRGGNKGGGGREEENKYNVYVVIRKNDLFIVSNEVNQTGNT